MKKAQLSIETMIIYGLVILIALSAIGALIYFNVLDLGSYLPNTCNIGGTGDLKCEEMKLVEGGNFELGIRNVGQNPIDHLQITVTDDSGVHFNTLGPLDAKDKSGNVIQSGNALAPGEIALVSVSAGGGVQSGIVLKGTIDTEYKFAGGVVTQEAKGSIRVKAT